MQTHITTHSQRRQSNGSLGTRRRSITTILICLVFLCSPTRATLLSTFEDEPLAPESFWNGSDLSGGFYSGGAFFTNSYNPDWGTWAGFAYANLTDTLAEGFQAQHHAITGMGQGGSAQYGISFVTSSDPPTITLERARTLAGVFITNNNYAYYDMLRGSAFSKQFGGDTGNDEDWFMLTITGINEANDVTGTVEAYLADFRFADNSLDYILDTWLFVDLTSLGEVKALSFALSSSDVGDFGMNTPTYFCLDNLIGLPMLSEPAMPGLPYGEEQGINGFVDSLTGQHADPADPNAQLNPLFSHWAQTVVDYQPADDLWSGPWNDPNRALGPVTGDNFDIVSLGDLDSDEIDGNSLPGHITLSFGDPCDPNNPGLIKNNNGYDFVVFENALISQVNTAGGSVQGQVLAELGYVEVSTNGQDFVRFPSVSLTEERVGPYGTILPGNVHNLAGKHPNANGLSMGTPFDLNDLAAHPSVVEGLVDLNQIHYVRIVDIPGSGDFRDEAQTAIDPNTGDYYSESHPIYDQWPTIGSGGFDLEAIGVLHEQQVEADINLDGMVDVLDMDLMNAAWLSQFGQSNFNSRCDLAQPRDGIVDANDYRVFASQWGQIESWLLDADSEQETP